VLFHDVVERGTFLTYVVAAAGAADLGVEQKCELVKTAQTVYIVEFAVLRQ